MPVVTATTLTRPEHVVEVIVQILTNAEELGLAHIGAYDELLTPAYPAALVLPGQFGKEYHGTHTYLHDLRCDIYVLHANMSQKKRTRSFEDCLLATRVIDALEKDRTFGNRIIQSLVISDQYAVLPARSQKQPAVCSTRLQWQGASESIFK